MAASESFVGDADFVVAFGDSIIRSKSSAPLLTRMIDSHIRGQSACTIGVCEVPTELMHNYGVVVPRDGETDLDQCLLSDIIEKPEPSETSSRLAVSARYVFGAQIFEQIRSLEASPGGEIYLTDAIRQTILAGRPVRAVRLRGEEKRYDIGNHIAYFKTFVDYAVEDPECGPEILTYLEHKVAELKRS